MKNKYCKTVVTICLLLFTTLFFGCDTVPANYEINFGCGGGFTARYHSYRVVEDGTVYYCVQSFTSPDYKKEGTIIGKISKEEIEEFYYRLEEIGFDDIDYVQPDNMSCSLGITVIDASHSVTWPMEFDTGSAPDKIKKVVEIFKDIEKLVTPLTPTPK